VLYRDCPTVEVEVRFPADPAEVWSLVSDISLPTATSSELYDVEWLDGATGPRPGARFLGRNRSDHIGEWESISTVVEADPDRRFVWEVAAAPGGALPVGEPWARWGFEVDPDPDGALVRVRQWARLGPGPSGMTLFIESAPEREARLVGGRLKGWRADMERTLALVRERTASTTV
jgi:hypothetical protein